MTKLDEVRAELGKLEETKKLVEALVAQQKKFVEELNLRKKQLFEIKTSYDHVVVPFIEGLLKLDSIQSEIKKAGQILGMGVDLIPIEKFYGYLGCLSAQDKSQLIHEDISPAVHGFEVWKLLREAKNGK